MKNEDEKYQQIQANVILIVLILFVALIFYLVLTGNYNKGTF